MARTNKKKTESAPRELHEGGARAREVLGLALVLVSLALCFSLFSYDPKDATGEKNLVGPLGAAVAERVVSFFGWLGYLTGIAAVALAGLVLFGRPRRPSVALVIALIATVLGVEVLLFLCWPEHGADRGGRLGLAVGELLTESVGLAGAGLTAVGLVLSGLVVMLRVSFRHAVKTGFDWVSNGLRHSWMVYRIRREASRAARRRREEMRMAEREARAEEERQARLQAQARQQAYDERARVAVLEATAREDARVMARIESERRSAHVPVRSTRRTTQAAVDSPPVLHDAAPPDTVLVPPPVPDTALLGPMPPDRSTENRSNGSAAVLEEVPTPVSGPHDPDPLIKAFVAPHEFPWSSRPPVENAADVLDRIDQMSSGDPDTEPEERSNHPANHSAEGPTDASPVSRAPERATLQVEPADVVWGVDALVPASERSTADASGAPPDEVVVDEQLIIHERKAVDADFGDDRPLPLTKRANNVPEKPAYVLPPINLLDYESEGPAPVDEQALKARATRLEQKLRTYGVEGKVMAIRPGPVVTTYEYQPAPGVKVAKIANLSDDIAMSMEAVRVRIVAPIPGRGVVGIELPNDGRENVYLKEIIAHEAFKHSKSLLTLALGKDAEGEPQVRDLRKMPHLMIAGTTGSGKSVSINTMVLSMLYKATPDEVKFIMVDPKMLELSLYNDIPHLLLPVVTDPKKASIALAWTVEEMERRYRLLSDAKVRDIQGFNKKVDKLRKQREAESSYRAARDAEGPEVVRAGERRHDVDAATPTDARHVADPWDPDDLPTRMPFIVVLIDEFADLMMAAPRDVEASVQRLAQKARAAGIHVLLATQRPSTDVITGVIKNNFPSRLAFRVASRHDSATVLNTPGAENLLGMGDSLFLSVASPNPVRVHGAFVSEDELERVAEFWKKQARPTYDPTILQPKEDEGADGFSDEDVDELYDQAVRFVTESRKASISALQRRLRVGYNRAARMIEMMEVQGIVGPVQGPKGEREIMVSAMGPDGPEPT